MQNEEQNVDVLFRYFCFSTSANITNILYVNNNRKNNDSQSLVKAKFKEYFRIFYSKIIV